MTPAQLKEELQQQREEIGALQELWRTLFDAYCPDEQQFIVWLRIHTFDRMVVAIRRTGRKYVKMQKQMTREHMVKLTSKIANDLKHQKPESAQAA